MALKCHLPRALVISHALQSARPTCGAMNFADCVPSRHKRNALKGLKNNAAPKCPIDHHADNTHNSLSSARCVWPSFLLLLVAPRRFTDDDDAGRHSACCCCYVQHGAIAVSAASCQSCLSGKPLHDTTTGRPTACPRSFSSSLLH